MIESVLIIQWYYQNRKVSRVFIIDLSKTRNRQRVWSRERRKFDKSIYSLKGICSRGRSLNSVFSKLLTLDYRFIIINRNCAWFKNNWAFDINNKLFYTILIYTYIFSMKKYTKKIDTMLKKYYNIKISVETSL